MAKLTRWLILEAVLNIDPRLFEDRATLAENLARHAKETIVGLDPSDPKAYIPAVFALGRRRLSRERQLRASEEHVEQFVQTIRSRRRSTRQRLIRHVTEAIGVLREVARQITQEPEEEWAERSSFARPVSLWLWLTDGQLAVLNGLLQHFTGVEGYFWGNEVKGDARKVAFREGRGGVETMLHRLLAEAARSLVALASTASRSRLAVCYAPRKPKALDSEYECGRFFVYSEQGGSRARSCSSTCDTYRRKREEEQEDARNRRALEENAEARRQRLARPELPARKLR